VGTFRYPVEVGDFEGTQFRALEALVDTGASYTSVPSDILAELGIEAQEERPFVLANGERVNYGLAWVRLRLDGREEPSLVIFGATGSLPLLGAFTLEGFGLGVDSANRRLVETPGYLVGLLTAADSFQ
jgi:aspartyl protease family protein